VRPANAAKGREGPLLSEALGSAGLGFMLFLVVASSIAGAGWVFAAALVITWLLLPALVGLRNTLDAGCAFMVVALGTAVVAALARSGVGSLLP
jgi:hypothetical protein